MKSKEYKKLLTLLPKGGVQVLADQFEKTPRQIYNDLQNDVLDVIAAATAMAKEEKKKREEQQSQTNQLVQSL